jgi:quercetin dioxygenase-like cupin family protein
MKEHTPSPSAVSAELNRRELLQVLAATLSLATVAPAFPTLSAAENTEPAAPAAGGSKVQTLAVIPIAHSADLVATIVTVEYPPGGASRAHRHSGTVVGYVLEGMIEFGTDQQPVKKVSTGQSFAEQPGEKHLVSRNASRSHPARVLAVHIGKKDKPVVVPVEEK